MNFNKNILTCFIIFIINLTHVVKTDKEKVTEIYQLVKSDESYHQYLARPQKHYKAKLGLKQFYQTINNLDYKRIPEPNNDLIYNNYTTELSNYCKSDANMTFDYFKRKVEIDEFSEFFNRLKNTIYYSIGQKVLECIKKDTKKSSIGCCKLLTKNELRQQIDRLKKKLSADEKFIFYRGLITIKRNMHQHIDPKFEKITDTKKKISYFFENMVNENDIILIKNALLSNEYNMSDFNFLSSVFHEYKQLTPVPKKSEQEITDCKSKVMPKTEFILTHISYIEMIENKTNKKQELYNHLMKQNGDITEEYLTSLKNKRATDFKDEYELYAMKLKVNFKGTILPLPKILWRQ